MSFGFQATKYFNYSLMTPEAAANASPEAGGGTTADWDWSILPVTFQGFGAPTVALGFELFADWGYGLTTKTAPLDLGFSWYPNVTFGIAQEQITIDDVDYSLDLKVCELPFTATMGEQPYFYCSMGGRPVWDYVVKPLQEI